MCGCARVDMRIIMRPHQCSHRRGAHTTTRACKMCAREWREHFTVRCAATLWRVSARVCGDVAAVCSCDDIVGASMCLCASPYAPVSAVDPGAGFASSSVWSDHSNVERSAYEISRATTTTIVYLLSHVKSACRIKSIRWGRTICCRVRLGPH